MIRILPAHAAIARAHGPFKLRRIHPGHGVSGDTGFGPLGLMDHARLSPGLVVHFHEHRDDEIISYLRRGVMWHEDTSGARLPLDPTHLAVMNSGSGLWHEETIPADGEPVEMLQIFVRPREAGLPPRFQHHHLAHPVSPDTWRHLVGPEGAGAPCEIRNQLWLYDATLAAGRTLATPPRDPRLDAWLYMFSGEAEADGVGALATGDALQLTDGAHTTLRARTDCALVAFTLDRSAPTSLAGTLSGGALR